MIQRAPEVRAAHLKLLVAALATELGGPRAEAVRALVPAWILRRIEAAARLDWLPVDYLVALCDAVEQRAEGDLERWGAGILRVLLQSPLVRAAYETTIALSRRDPAVVVPRLLVAWPLLYSGCGDLVVAETSPGAVRLVQAKVPPALRRASTVRPLVGALGAIPADCGLEGGAEAEWSPDSSRFVYVIRWRPDRAP